MATIAGEVQMVPKWFRRQVQWRVAAACASNAPVREREGGAR
jgi:hypothetical protein